MGFSNSHIIPKSPRFIVVVGRTNTSGKPLPMVARVGKDEVNECIQYFKGRGWKASRLKIREHLPADLLNKQDITEQECSKIFNQFYREEIKSGDRCLETEMRKVANGYYINGQASKLSFDHPHPRVLETACGEALKIVSRHYSLGSNTEHCLLVAA